jgi:hypothetical protein
MVMTKEIAVQFFIGPFSLPYAGFHILFPFMSASLISRFPVGGFYEGNVHKCATVEQFNAIVERSEELTAYVEDTAHVRIGTVMLNRDPFCIYSVTQNPAHIPRGRFGFTGYLVRILPENLEVFCRALPDGTLVKCLYGHHFSVRAG